MTIVIPWCVLGRQIGVMITTAEKTGLRKKMLDACIAKQNFLMDDFRERIKSLAQSKSAGNEDSYDNADMAANEMAVSEINTLNEQLKFAEAELELLENLRITQDLERNDVSLGAIVVTDHHTFFISASLEKFTTEGRSYVGISTYSPIFLAMDGKRKGDSFTFRGVHYKIKDIF